MTYPSEPAQPGLIWRKSSYSTGQNDCVEVARIQAAVLIRDSKDPRGGHLAVSARTWESLISSIKNGGQG